MDQTFYIPNTNTREVAGIIRELLADLGAVHESFSDDPDDEGAQYVEARRYDGNRRILIASVRLNQAAHRVKVNLHISDVIAEEAAADVLRQIKEDYPKCSIDASEPEQVKRGPNDTTIERAKLYKSIKDKHPNWSYFEVAMEANHGKMRDGKDNHTEDTVRNTYRAMAKAFPDAKEWKWERSDKIR